MNQPSVFVAADTNQAYSRKWRIGGMLSLDVSPALLSLTARSKTRLFPLRPPAVKTALSL
jgi:hypothetical protein